jgi:hypothetical protein
MLAVVRDLLLYILIINVLSKFLYIILVTPLDVVKIRLQAQQKAMLSNKCYLYCNGLMDHICSCANGQGGISESNWIKANGKFRGTLVLSCKCINNKLYQIFYVFKYNKYL